MRLYYVFIQNLAKMKKLIIPILFFSPALAFAQEVATDSVDAVELQELVVAAPTVIHKNDKDLYIPKATTIERSTSAFSLLQNMLIPGVTVNTVLETVTAQGQPVQLRINGREATIQQVKAILPENVKRVEYIDNPGLRYNGATTVVNFIVRNPEVGGALMLDAMQSLKGRFGQYSGSLQLNHGKSQFSVDVNGKWCHNAEMYREYSETFTYPDGSVLKRTETPISGSACDEFLTPSLTYSYINPEKTTIWASASLIHRYPTGMRFLGDLELSDMSRNILLSESNFDDGNTPSLGFYIEQKMPHNQTLVASLSGHHFGGAHRREYSERYADSEDFLTNVNSDIRDRNWAYGAEMDYIKEWEKSQLTAGVNYNGNRNSSTYKHLDNKVYHQNQNSVYLFGEYMQTIGKVSLTGGLGAHYTAIDNREANASSHKWSFRPRLSARWRYNDSSAWRLDFESWTVNPTLSETNPAEQILDGFQYQVGNTDLKPYMFYRGALQYNFSLPWMEGSVRGRYTTSRDAIMPYMQWNGDRLMTSYANGGKYASWLVQFSPQFNIIPDWLMASAELAFEHVRTSGQGYKHLMNDFTYNITLMANHWNWGLMLQVNEQGKRLWGETIEKAEFVTIAGVTYNWKDFQFMAGMMMPFGKYNQGSEVLNRYNNHVQTVRSHFVVHMPFVKISYNLAWGKQKRGASRLIDNGSSVQQSKAAGR